MIGPRVKPVRVPTGQRAVSYHNEYFVEDEWGNAVPKQVDSIGQEITAEVNVCPDDAREHYGIEAPARSSVEVVGGKSYKEKLAEPMRVKLVSAVVHSALDRVNHDSVRAKADCMIVVPGIKSFVDDNPKFVF